MPTPRVSCFMGGPPETATWLSDTWIEPESLAYPHGGFTRRTTLLQAE